jgi:hypothetical protein
MLYCVRVCVVDARTSATQFDCKYVETSAALNHHVDELLVGIVSQIRLKLNPELSDSLSDSYKRKSKAIKCHSQKGARGLLHKLFRKSSKKVTQPCDDLYKL